ncbi:MAG: hypothetical protein IPJ42_05080 [Betaproteobacteria bacterium]|nr:hypothetical protein [Betaproteobacteria bacterium]
MQRQGLADPVRAGTQPAPAPAAAAAHAERAAAKPAQSGLADLLAHSPRGLAQGAVVSSLQSGPRALAQRRQMATSAPARVAQRYTVVEAGQQKPNYWQGLGAALRVADDGKMAVKHIDGAPRGHPDYQHFSPGRRHPGPPAGAGGHGVGFLDRAVWRQADRQRTRCE